MRQKILKKLIHIAASSKNNLKNLIHLRRIIHKSSLSTSEIENLFQRIHQSNSLNIAHKYTDKGPFTQIIFDHEKWDLTKINDQLFINQFIDNNRKQSFRIKEIYGNKLLSYILDCALKKTLDFGVNELRKSNESNQRNSFENENRSLEWLRVSLEVFKKALGEVQIKDDLALEFLIGLDCSKRTLIFKSYNIFWQIHFHHSLMRIQFYNDKDQRAQRPSMAGDFYHLKNQIWDQYILVIEKLSQTFDKKII